MTRLLETIGKLVTVTLFVAFLPVWLRSGDALPAPNLMEPDQRMQECGSEIPSTSDVAPACAETSDTAEDRAFLVETATPGYTMMHQGPDVAIGRLHPEFVRRLAAAIHEAREAGLASAGIFSAYRPPAFGVGGFSDKFNSLHSYGLAVDMAGIGRPGSTEAKTWYEIAARHGVVCPYGVENRVEWTHCQPTWLKAVRTQNPLRETITAEGPVSLENMFEAGTAIIDAASGNPTSEAHPGPGAVARTEAMDRPAHPHVILAAQVAPRARCRDEAQPHAGGCPALRTSQSGERRTAHAHQAGDRGGRESHRV